MLTKTNHPEISSNKTSLLIPVLAYLFICTVLSGVIPQTILSLGIVIGFGLLFLMNKLYLAFPFLVFYYSVYGTLFGLSVFRIFTLFVIFNLLVKASSKITIKSKYLPILLVYSLFLITVMMPINMREGFFLLFDIICCLSVINDITSDNEVLSLFFKVYSLVCISSFITGTITGNSIGDEYNYLRFTATFEDPNYMGFCFTVAIFSIITLKLFSKKIRCLLVIALYAMLLSSLSITAILANILLWIFYLLITKRLNLPVALIIITVIILLVSMFNYGLENPDAPVLGDLSARINEKLQSLDSGDISDVTTGRTELSKYNLNYYLSLPAFNLIFGGTPVNPRYVHPDLRSVSHNEYIDLLLNVGVLGTLVMVGFFIFSYWSYLKKYLHFRDKHDLCLLIIKSIWLIYSFTLTMFIDFRFTFIFLI